MSDKLQTLRLVLGIISDQYLNKIVKQHYFQMMGVQGPNIILSDLLA